MTTINPVLASYLNGNCKVVLHEDGTKVRYHEDDEKPLPEHPESIDIKITDFCDMGCLYCHESSTIGGKHGNLSALLSHIESLPAGVELAIGGGNPLSHPDLLHFLRKLKDKGIIANITVNQGHIKEFFPLIRYLTEKELVKGIGISITSRNYETLVPVLNLSKDVVFHVIAGVNSPHLISELNELGPNVKVLVLGFKTFGRGVSFEECMSGGVRNNIQSWKFTIPPLLGKVHLSFDNLAIQQLEIKRLFTPEGWSKFYMGDDGSFTMYIDAVEGNYASTSRSAERTSWHSCSLLNFFHSLRKNHASVPCCSL